MLLIGITIGFNLLGLLLGVLGYIEDRDALYIVCALLNLSLLCGNLAKVV